MQNIVITGATGLIGTSLVKLLKDNYKITVLTRNSDRLRDTGNIRYVRWDGKTPFPETAEGAFAIINLAGENIGGKRWTSEEKRKILDSRISTAKAVRESILQCSSKPLVWIQASATGYYGLNNGTTFNEHSPKGTGSFLADVCAAWEKPINETDIPDLRKVIIRTGVVLSHKSELWKQLTMSFRFGIAALPAGGKQYLPWIHTDDETAAIKFLLENDCSGIFNLSSPAATTMREIITCIKSYEKTFLTIPVPKFPIQMIFGKEKTEEIVLTDQMVTPERLLQSGFVFKYDTIEKAVSDLCKKKSGTMSDDSTHL